jgi:phosphoribosylformimino-5-aminoimidazole carboxamide ribotide isomerase
MMQIIPAIDLKGGRCVRLLQGRDDATTEYSADPVAVADEWVRQGARRVHVVNLDGAFGRDSLNLEVFRNIARGRDIVWHLGGGLRSMESVTAAFDAGAGKAVVGTAAINDPAFLAGLLKEFGGEKIIVALDARGGRVVTHGWTETTSESVESLTRRVHDLGVTEILYTDVARDGMLTGPDLETLGRLADIGPSVLASGGVSSVADIEGLAALRKQAITGVIVGKALYENRFTLAEAISASRVA